MICSSMREALGRLEEATNGFFRRPNQDTMTKIHDVPCRTSLFDGFMNPSSDHVVGAEQDGRIHVSLNAHVGTESLPSNCYIHGVVHRNNIHSGLAHSFENAGTAADVKNHRSVRMGSLHLLHNPSLIRSSKGIVILRTKVTGPRVEHLHNLRARIDLVAAVLSDTISKLPKQLVKDCWIGKCHAFDRRVVLGSLAFYDVGCKGPGSPNETENSGLITDLFAQSLKNFSNKWKRLLRLQRMKFVDLFFSADRRRNQRPFFLQNIELDPNSGQRR
mmetsp:Transcript_15569/g.26778  ORF Transcript_15569/g.26778 Transcript_15569/m.26778 type:complete len:274 (+) Transcript_15569:197-1018(+)